MAPDEEILSSKKVAIIIKHYYQNKDFLKDKVVASWVMRRNTKYKLSPGQAQFNHLQC